MMQSSSSDSEEDFSVLPEREEDEMEVVFPKMKVYENVLTGETALGTEIIIDADVREKMASNIDKSPNSGVNKADELDKASGSVCGNASEAFGMSDIKDPVERDSSSSDDIFCEVDFESIRRQLFERVPIYGRPPDRSPCTRGPTPSELGLGVHCHHPTRARLPCKALSRTTSFLSTLAHQ
ncbi:hypothetical protein CEXT_462531 [Caerostris extrusa]|uniref:Uncharacterized protein n=1 Tax=Caerostris extrusa TaxID=172846 RepID=A0AAV4QZH5_CAEEX|nr:hypothetical protein CEXT_462531 [Caerostris extrusa]